jgi:aldehyde dehydrogenase (NAD+)
MTFWLLLRQTFLRSSTELTVSDMTHRTEEFICEVSAGTKENVDTAVKVARAAFEGPWRYMDGTARGKKLLKLSDFIEADLEKIATLESLDGGKTYAKALIDTQEVADVFRYYGGWADKNYGQTIDSGKHRLTYTIREPLGVCGGIIP